MKMFLMKILTRTVFRGIMLDVWEWIDRPTGKQKDYLADMKYIAGSEAFQNELNKIKNAAGKAIMRTTENNAQIAWNRGVLHGIDTLEKRLKSLSNQTIKK